MTEAEVPMDLGRAYLADEAATLRAGGALSDAASPGTMVYLEGDLGVGKTCFCRGLIQAMGYDGNVKSPTFTLVEPYEFADLSVYHIDLYRLGDPEELEYIGISDYSNGGFCLVEWPERGEGLLPRCDLRLCLMVSGRGRELTWRGETPRGKTLAECFQRLWPQRP